MDEIGATVRYVVTINEPCVYVTESYYNGTWPPNVRSKWQTYRVLSNLAYAHNQVAKVLHAKSRRFKVAVAKNSAYTYPGDDAWLSRATARVVQFFQDDYFLRKVVRQSDYIAVNYYFSNRIYGYRIHNPETTPNDLGWTMQPDHLELALERLWSRYKLPLLVTENGVADERDQFRKQWLTQSILAMQRALGSGVELLGYMHWSFLDNFEWDKGFWPRFGLFAVDYKTYKRTPRPSALWFARVLQQQKKQAERPIEHCRLYQRARSRVLSQLPRRRKLHHHRRALLALHQQYHPNLLRQHRPKHPKCHHLRQGQRHARVG